MINNFATGLIDAVRTRGWSYRELGRRSGVSDSLVSLVASEQREPSPDFCIAIARAFGEREDKWLRLGGHLSELPPEVKEEEEVIRILRTMPQERRSTVVAMLQGLDGGGRRASPPQPVQDDDVSALRRFLAEILVSIVKRLPPEDERAVYDEMKEKRDQAEGRLGELIDGLLSRLA